MINPWTSKGRILASYRNNGVFEIRDLAEARYVAFVRDEDLDKVAGHIAVEDDFPGWKRLIYIDWDSRKHAVALYPSLIHEGDCSPVRRFLTDHNCKLDPPKRGYMDIESDSRVSFDLATQGFARTLSWAVVDEDGNSWSGCLAEDTDEAEVELLCALWERMGEFDQIGAWSGDRFDFPFIKERSMKLAKHHKIDAMWEHHRRLLFVDHLALFKRHHMAPESGDDKTSLKLEDVSQALIGEGKHDVPEELKHITGKRTMGACAWDLWAAGGRAREALVAYNVQDALLLPKIEAATGYFALQQTIAEFTLTPVSSHGIKPMAFVDAYLLKMAHKRQTHLPSKKEPTGLEKEARGAHVFDCEIRGIARDVHVCDFKSLYPTIGRTWNVGHETIHREGCTAANGVSFATDVESMIGAFWRETMAQRDHWKQEMKKYPPGTPDWKYAERLSKGGKIVANSGYGVFGSPFFRLYDVNIVEAITLGGQFLIKATAEAATSRGWKIVAGDTDSLFVQGATVEEFGAFVDWCNAELYPKILKDHGCRKDLWCVGLAYEKCFSRLVAPLGKDGRPAAKRYFGSYRHYGGKAGLPVPGLGETFDKTKHSRPEIRGLEYMRGDSVRAARRMQEECIRRILAGETDPESLEEWVKDKRRKFFDDPIDVADIAMSKGISRDLDAYKTEGPHVRIAREMSERGEDVGEGTRISYVVVDGSVSPTKVISVDEFDGKTFDRHHYWMKSVYPPTLRVLAGAFPDRPWDRWTGKRPKAPLPGQLGLGLT